MFFYFIVGQILIKFTHFSDVLQVIMFNFKAQYLELTFNKY